MRQIVFSLCHWEHEGSERLCSLSRITQPSKSLRPAPSLAAQPSCCFPQSGVRLYGRRAQGQHLDRSLFSSNRGSAGALG